MLLRRAGITQTLPEFQDLQEVEAMLEENMADWWEQTRLRAHAQGLAEGRAEGLETGRAEGRAEGLETGRAEGRAEGRETGRAEGAAALRLTVRDLLTDRFGTLPEATTEAMDAVTELDDMRRLASSVYRAPSLEAFLELLEEILRRNERPQ